MLCVHISVGVRGFLGCLSCYSLIMIKTLRDCFWSLPSYCGSLEERTIKFLLPLLLWTFDNTDPLLLAWVLVWWCLRRKYDVSCCRPSVVLSITNGWCYACHQDIRYLSLLVIVESCCVELDFVYFALYWCISEVDIGSAVMFEMYWTSKGGRWECKRRDQSKRQNIPTKLLIQIDGSNWARNLLANLWVSRFPLLFLYRTTLVSSYMYIH